MNTVTMNELEDETNYIEDVRPWGSQNCTYAAYNGNLETLKLLHESGVPWDSFCFHAGVQSGNIEVLEYLHENECPWDNFEFSIDNKSLDVDHDGKVINLEISIGEHENKCPSWNESSFAFAVRSRNIDTVKYLRDNDYPMNERSYELTFLSMYQTVLELLNY